MPAIKASTNNSTSYFNLDGLDYEKGMYSLYYDSVEKNTSGVIDETKIRVGLKSKVEIDRNLVLPKLITDWTDGTTAYSDFDTLIADVSTLIAAASGGTEYQVYEQDFLVDVATADVWWYGSSSTLAMSEYNTWMSVANTASMATVSSIKLITAKPIGVAVGNQTINSMRFQFGVNVDKITGISIAKVRLSSNHTVIDSINILYENNSVTIGTDGYFDLVDTDFTITSITDKDLIYVFFIASSINNVTPSSMRLKCSID
jgi:hypothetical protein